MTTLIGTGFSSLPNAFEAAKAASQQAANYFNRTTPHLVIVFTSVHFQGPALLEGICSVFGDATPIIGCSGSGIITTSGVHKYGVALMAFHSSSIMFGIGAVKEINKNNPRESGAQCARAALKTIGATTKEISLILSDGLMPRGSELLLGFKDVLGRSFPIIGGSSADNLHFAKTYQYYNREILHNAIIGAILSGEGSFGYGARHGWQPLGRPHTVTKSLGNIIYAIEEKPAVEFYKEYFKKTTPELQSVLNHISVLYPFGVYLAGEEEFLLRNIHHINTDGSIVCQGDIEQGSQIRLMMGTKESALAAAQQAALEAKTSLKENPLLCALIFESTSRMLLFGSKINEEIEVVKQSLGDIPFIGVCTYGEQAPLRSLGYHGESRFHNETITIFTLGEHRAHAA